MMSNEIITLGNNLQPPCVDMDITHSVYECVRTDEFEVATFNALLVAVVTYLDTHGADYGDNALPWAESVLTDE